MGEIKRITNQSDFDVSYVKVEHTTDHGYINANDQQDNVNMWFPWVDNQQQFMDRTIIIEVVGIIRIFFWESGNYIYYAMSKDNLVGAFDPKTKYEFVGNEFASGKIAPGDPSKGWKELEIRNDGEDISVKLYNYQ